MRKLFIEIDFDKTIVSFDYPDVGKLMNGAKEVINKWYENHCIIISTCRSGEHEQRAKQFLLDSDVRFHYFNENSQERINQFGSDTRKISCDIRFDDTNAGGFMGWAKADEMVNSLSNKKPVIICIIGESLSGKTTLADWIERQYGIKMIQSYTDRPRRSEDEDGHTFLTSEEFDLLREEDMIAHTKYGDYRYCCLKSDVQDENTYVIDEDGYLMLLSKHRNVYDIKSIRLKCDERVRVMRGTPTKDTIKRIERDKGRFTLPDIFYDAVVDTTHIEIGQYFIDLNRWLNRGWW